jgi:hypothetical protein
MKLRVLFFWATVLFFSSLSAGELKYDCVGFSSDGANEHIVYNHAGKDGRPYVVRAGRACNFYMLCDGWFWKLDEKGDGRSILWGTYYHTDHFAFDTFIIAFPKVTLSSDKSSMFTTRFESLSEPSKSVMLNCTASAGAA